MTPEQHAGMVQAVRAVIRSGAPAEAEDLRQEAWVVALSVAPRCPSDTGAYIARVVRRQLHNAASRWYSVVALPHRQLRHAHLYGRRCEVTDGMLVSSETPEALVGNAQLTSAVRAEMGRVLSRLNMDRYGASRHSAYRARLKFAGMVRRDRVVVGLWRLLREGR